MKKLIASILAMSFLGIALPMASPFQSDGGLVATIQAKSKKKKSKLEKAKEKDTKTRIKRLKSMGVAEEFYTGTYGGHMSRREFGEALAKWIVYVYTTTGQLPSFKSSDLSDWVVLKINGQCISGAAVCKRWEE
ncbi:MAG: hypothetical protein FJZ04_04205 [Candidatus Moranbacteria bacterium]|nr:hypothetical protein [Candidatus Moranbacteria bacterium]